MDTDFSIKRENRCPILKDCICDLRSRKEENDAVFPPDFDCQEKLRYEQLWKRLVKGGTIWCICLQDRHDRYLESSAEFHKYGLCRLVEYYRPQRPSALECAKKGIKQPSWYGIWNSLRYVVSASLKRGDSSCFSFEDDCHFYESRMSTVRLQKIVEDVENLQPNWGVFKLGQCAQLGHFVSSSVLRSLSWLCQAVLWSSKGMKCLQDTTYESYMKRKQREKEVDSWMMGAMPIYATFPQLVHQSNSETSNLGTNDFDRFYRTKVMSIGRGILNRCDWLADIATHFVLPVILILVIIAMFVFIAIYFNRFKSLFFHQSGETAKKNVF
jgi:hypothetical protein